MVVEDTTVTLPESTYQALLNCVAALEAHKGDDDITLSKIILLKKTVADLRARLVCDATF